MIHRDPVLGVLRYSTKEALWEARVSVGAATLGFRIGGSALPGAPLISHARDIVQHFDGFQERLSAFFADEARRHPALAGAIEQLELEGIDLCWPERPDDGMIYFRSPDAEKVWRCDYVDRTLSGLGFDD